MIDDYYYSGKIMAGNITFDIVWQLWRLYEIDIFERSSQFFFTAGHDADILVDDEVREIVTEMCVEAADISDDTRFQSIVEKMQTDIDAYKDQPFSLVRIGFE